MRVCNKCSTPKSLEEFPIQKGCSEGRRPTCKVCMAAKTKKWREEDPVRAKASQLAVKARNPGRWYEKERVRTRRYKANNAEKVREASRAYSKNSKHVYQRYYEANKQALIAKAATWYRNNIERARVNSLHAVRRRTATKLHATPRWADQEEIKWIYEKRAEIVSITGIEFHVDHIVPLQSKEVCGLHVADNLRIIEASENASKSNKLIESLAYEAN